jgi:3-hydroxy-9,10-secoandrosta-1,3,5(10)-triene-9,17-dione monooxygenase reductase component
MSSERSGDRFRPLSSDEFRHACSRFATGVTIASVLDSGGTPHGLTVNSFASVSLSPPLVLICLGQEVTMIDAFRAAGYFGISVLSETQRELAERFARKGHDRFGGTRWHAGATGVPLLDDSLAEIECAVTHRFTAGDHEILVGEMLAAHIGEGAPLIYHASRYRELAR